MLPIVAIIGRTNVGKSTLFNRLTRSRKALVADQPALTRDRQYGTVNTKDRQFILTDTGGIGTEETDLDHLITEQCEKAIHEADVICFVVDAQAGLLPADEEIADKLRRSGKLIILAVNKSENLKTVSAVSDFYRLGFEKIIPISAAQNEGIDELLREILLVLPAALIEKTAEEKQGIKIAVVGKPNVGKSTLINYLLAEERVIVSDESGTTRDSIAIPFEYKNKFYTLIDTAGIRRRRSVYEKIEKFSIVQTLQTIENSQVVIFIIDATQNITEQDLRLLGLVLNSGRPLVLLINKWDIADEDARAWVKKELDRRLKFLDFVQQRFVSAKKGKGLKDLFLLIEKVYQSSVKPLKTGELNRILHYLAEKHQPPLVSGRRIKLRYAHAGGRNPPIIVIHGTQVKSLPNAYKRYLENGFRKALNLVGTPIRVELREGENPYV